MPRLALTRELAQAAGRDAANRAMWAGGRRAWNEEDANIAWRELARLWPLCIHKVEPGCCPFDDCVTARHTSNSPPPSRNSIALGP